MSRSPKMSIPDDWVEEEHGYTTVLFCLPNSPKWRAIVNGIISNFAYGRYWDEQTGNIKNTTLLGERIFDSMAMCEIEEKLERIAVALEGINEKTEALVTWDELLEQIETAIGVSNLTYKTFSTILGWMPSFRNIPIKTSEIVKMVVEGITWKGPILMAVTTIAASQTTIALSSIASAAVSAWQGIFAVGSYIDNWRAGMAEWILGEKSFYDIILKPLWALLMFQKDGGEVPDSAEDNRQEVRNVNRILVQNTINACCVGMPLMPTPPTNYVTPFEQPGTVSPTVPTLDDGFGWNTALGTDAASKCLGASYVIKSTIEFFNGIDDALGIENLGTFSLTHFVGGITTFIFLMALPVIMPTALLIALAGTILAAATAAVGTLVGQQIADVLEEEKECLAGLLVGTNTVGEAKAALEDHMSGRLSGPLLACLMAYWNGTVLTLRFRYRAAGTGITQFPIYNNAAPAFTCECPTDDYDVTPIAPTVGPSSYPGGEYTSSTSDGQPSHNANIDLRIYAPVDQAVTFGVVAETGVFPIQVQYTNLSGSLAVTPSINIGDLPYTVNVRAGAGSIYRIYARYQYVGNFEATVNATDLNP